MEITKEMVDYVSTLSRLKLDEAAKEKMQGELQQIIAYMDVLNTLDTEGVEPMSHVFPVKNVLREDEVKPSTPREALLRKEICQETQLRRMKAATGIDTDLCGLCFAVCPHTQRYLRGRAGNRSIKPINRRTPPGVPLGNGPRGALLCRGSGAAGVPWAGGLHPVCSPIFGGQNLEGVPEGLGELALVLVPHLLGDVPDAAVGLPEQAGGLLHPVVLHVGGDGLAIHRLEHRL